MFNDIFQMRNNPSDIQDSLFLILLIGMTFIIVFAFCWQPGYLDGDSLGYAQTAKWVADSGRWLAIKDSSWGGQFYYHFPLAIWVSALSFKIFGVNVVSASLFSLLSCLGAVIAIFYFGKIIKNNWVGFFASVVFLLINYTPRLAQQCRMDMPLTLFIILSLYFFILAVRGKKTFYLLFGLFTSLAIMTKDVNGLAPLAIACIYLLISRQFKKLIDPYFLFGFVISFIPVLLWIWLEKHIYGETLFAKWLNWNFLHLLRHKELAAPFYYYPREIIKRYFYFVPIFVHGAFLAIRQAKTRESDQPLLILTWAVFIPFAFSFGNRKLHYFIYSMYPAAALLAGIALNELCKQKIKLRILKIFIVGLIFLGLLRLSIPVRWGKTFFMDKVQVAAYIDSLLQEEQHYDFFTFNQHDAALIIYSQELDNITHIKDYESLKNLLENKASVNKRFCLINKVDFNSLSASIKNGWHILLILNEEILIANRL
ncbi:MAG: glycosyltransferase family 39 protein [Candidatus Omnitrophica bacterium]|nr:glycosyltransferase family 39 protein [Candidatus Omnitrophota bacterium]